MQRNDFQDVICEPQQFAQLVQHNDLQDIVPKLKCRMQHMQIDLPPTNVLEFPHF